VAIRITFHHISVTRYGSIRNCKIGEHLEVTGKIADLMCPVCLVLSCLKMQISPDNLYMMDRNVVAPVISAARLMLTSESTNIKLLYTSYDSLTDCVTDTISN